FSVRFCGDPLLMVRSALARVSNHEASCAAILRDARLWRAPQDEVSICRFMRSHLLERHINLAALLEPIRHRQVLGAHEIRIEQFRLIAVSGIAEHGDDGMTRS